ncbi:MAG: glycogen synthase [Sulfurimonas sp.]|uniref:glycogen synthase n=1 Tax=Sulfurimonas sp. TaxID=2022749 RepID=UPI0025ECE5F8|nr:glycogen/starch synthase [Sulfurimonas sp.]MCK9490959.1 glycogen synthase [Sulfurimonas sp.]
MKILFASSEMFPYAKSGGLADVAASLPKSLSKFVDISTLMPMYGFMQKEELVLEYSDEISLGGVSYKLKFYKKDNTATYFVEAPLLSDTQNLYGDEFGDYVNNDLRFGIFCKAIVVLAKRLSVDVLHLNDWHTALSSLYLKEEKSKIKTLFTIHNLSYQGIFSKKSLKRLSIGKKYFNIDGLEFYEKISFLKAGIAYSDAVTTVSPTYAKEILTKEFGCGLEGFLKYHKNKLYGILNGIDTNLFNPKTDLSLYKNFDYKSLDKKEENKKAFFKNSSLKNSKIPLFVMVTRLVEQKGIDLLIKSLKKILSKKINLYVVGEGSPDFVAKLEKFSKKYENFEFTNIYDEALSHRIYAAADFLLMPSKFEPCGLSQMISMTYGAIPIVHEIGGLKDSVIDGVDGIVFKGERKKDLTLAVERAMDLRKRSELFNSMRVTAMKKDLSFTSSALKYIEIYKKILS